MPGKKQKFGTPFTMKGSPMQRNFDISPAKEKKAPEKYSSVIRGNTMTRYDSKGKVVSTFTKNPKKDFKSGEPSEQSKESWILDT